MPARSDSDPTQQKLAQVAAPHAETERSPSLAPYRSCGSFELGRASPAQERSAEDACRVDMSKPNRSVCCRPYAACQGCLPCLGRKGWAKGAYLLDGVWSRRGVEQEGPGRFRTGDRAAAAAAAAWARDGR
jgi:hypothetical protein